MTIGGGGVLSTTVLTGCATGAAGVATVTGVAGLTRDVTAGWVTTSGNPGPESVLRPPPTSALPLGAGS